MISGLANQVVDPALNREFAAWSQAIDTQYSAMAQKLAPNSNLDTVSALKSELATAKSEINALKTDISSSVTSKTQALKRLKSTTISLLNAKTTLTSMPLIKAFLLGAGSKGNELQTLAQGLVQTIEAGPDFTAAAKEFRSQKGMVSAALSGFKQDAAALVLPALRGNGIPADKRWMFSPAFLQYADIASSKPPAGDP